MAVPPAQQADGNVALSRDAREVRDIVHRLANGVQEPQTVVAKRRIVRIDRHLVEKRVDRRRASCDSARMAPSKSSASTAFARSLRRLRRDRRPATFSSGSPCAARGRIGRLVIERAVLLLLDAQDVGGALDSRRAGSRRPRCRGSGRAPRRGGRSSADRPGLPSANTASMRSCRAPCSRR